MQTIHSYHANHSLMKIKIIDLLKMPMLNWIHNRPPDMNRSNEIAEYIIIKQPVLDWLFYIVSQKDKYEMLDGIHRFTALHIIHKKIEENTVLIGFNKDAFYNMDVLLSVRINPSLGECVDLFQNINKSVPIAELYVRVMTDMDKRRILEDVYIKWSLAYPSHFTHCNRPQIPNTNRDRFIDFLDHIYEKLNITPSNKNCLEEKLIEINKEIQENIPAKISQKVIDKCNISGCYLFLVRNESLQDFVV